MKQRCKIYTTSSTRWIEDNIPTILSYLNKSKGRKVEKIDVEKISIPTPQTYRSTDGKTRIVSDWFREYFTSRSEGYNVIVFHFTKYYKKKWGLTPGINGTYWNDPDENYEFWLCADRGETKEGYTEFDNFTRIFLHEWAHGDGHVVPIKNQVEYVHAMDYKYQSVHQIFKTLDFTRWNTQRRLVDLLTEVVILYRKLWKLSK